MGVTQRRADIGMAKKAGDHRHRHAVHHRVTGMRVTEIVKANVLDSGFPPGAIPEREVAAARPGGISRGRKDEGASAARPAFENAPGRSAEGNDPGARLAVGEDQPVAIDFRPAQPEDLAPAATGQEQEPDDIRLLSTAVAGLPVQHPMEPGYLLPGQEARQHPSRVSFHGPCGVGVEVAAGDREVDDLREKIKRVIGVARSGPAEPVEPSPDVRWGDAVERLRAEGRQELAVERGSHALPGGRLVSFEMGFLPRALDEIPEQRSHPPGRASRLRLRACLSRMAFAAGLGDGLQRHRAERDAPRPPARVLQQDIAPPAGGPNPDAEAGDKAVPDRVFPRAGSEAGDGAVGEPYAFPGGHGSALQRGADGLGGVHHRLVGKVGVLERGFGTAVTEQFGDGQHGLALPQSDAGMRVAEVVEAHAAQPGFGTNRVPEPFEPALVPRPFAARRREHPLSGPVQPVEKCSGRAATARRCGAQSCCRGGRGDPRGSRTSGVSGSRSCGIPSAGGAG